jgi:Rad3-related DNA helicase
MLTPFSPVQVCPYYGSRRALPAADIIIAPYSALLMEEARTALGLQVEGSVLVFDEAHNLLDSLQSTHSTSITGAHTEMMLGVELGSQVQIRHGDLEDEEDIYSVYILQAL